MASAAGRVRHPGGDRRCAGRYPLGGQPAEGRGRPELSPPRKLLVASQPTRGLDVGSIEYVHRRIVEDARRGRGRLLVSTELDEVMALGDRIAVMYRGRIVGVVPPSVSRERIGLMMAGIEEGTALTAPTEEAR